MKEGVMGLGGTLVEPLWLGRSLFGEPEKLGD